MGTLRDVGERWTVSSLLGRLEDAPAFASPTTREYRSRWVAEVRADRLGAITVGRLTSERLSAAVRRWQREGVGRDAVRGRVSVVRLAVTSAVQRGYLVRDVLAGARGVAGGSPREHVPVSVVCELVTVARHDLVAARAASAARPEEAAAKWAVFRAHQGLLLICLVADAGLRRGELAALRTDDLEGRELWVERATKRIKGGVFVGPTKTYRSLRITLSKTTAQLWREYVLEWWGPTTLSGVDSGWLFPARPGNSRAPEPGTLAYRLTTLTHKLAASRESVSLHRLRHTVATSLVRDGQVTAAQRRLRHRKLDTTLRHYVDTTDLHDDVAVADELAALYRNADDHQDDLGVAGYGNGMRRPRRATWGADGDGDDE